MPEDIENYIHRIGRTGRGNHQGVATTFVNSKSCDKSILLDLQGLSSSYFNVKNICSYTKKCNLEPKTRILLFSSVN